MQTFATPKYCAVSFSPGSWQRPRIPEYCHRSCMWFSFSIMRCTASTFSSVTAAAGQPWQTSSPSETRPQWNSLYHLFMVPLDGAWSPNIFYSFSAHWWRVRKSLNQLKSVIRLTLFLPQDCCLKMHLKKYFDVLSELPGQSYLAAGFEDSVNAQLLRQ